MERYYLWFRNIVYSPFLYIWNLFFKMGNKTKLSMIEMPIQKEGYVPYRKRRCIEDPKIRRTISQEKGLHELHVEHEREKMLRGRSASCPLPLQKMYYAHYLFIDKFKVEEGDDYPYLFL